MWWLPRQVESQQSVFRRLCYTVQESLIFYIVRRGEGYTYAVLGHFQGAAEPLAKLVRPGKDADNEHRRV